MSEACSICLEALDADDARGQCSTPCGHRFHSTCLFRAMVERQSCPLCREQLIPAPPSPEATLREVTTVRVEITPLGEVRRQQRNYQARRRRMERTHSTLRASKRRLEASDQALRACAAECDDAVVATLRGSPRVQRLLREQQRCERRYVRANNRHKRLVVERLGEPPEVDAMYTALLGLM